MRTEKQIEKEFRNDFKALLKKYDAIIETDADSGCLWIETKGAGNGNEGWKDEPCYFSLT